MPFSPVPVEAGSRLKSTLRDLFAIDLRSLAAFRIAISIFVLVDLSLRAADLAAMYTDDGMFSRETISRHYSIWDWSFHFGSGSWAYQALLFALAAAFAVALCIGYETRLATVASWLMLVSLHNRVPLVLGGADNLARLLLFWGMFLPLGAAWSVDAWMAKRKGIRRSTADSVLSVASAASLLQMAFVYLFSAAFKSNPDWFQGTAVAAAFGDGFFGKPLAAKLLAFPTLLSVLTISVLIVEWLAPFLLFSPIRTASARLWVLGFLALMHVGIEITLNVGLFSLVSLSGLLLFVPSMAWRKLRANGVSDVSERPDTAGRVSRTSAPFPASYLANGICTFALAYVVYTNINGLPGRFLPWTPPPKVEFFTVSCGLGQQWDMFAEPAAKNGWCVALATLVDGTQVDLLRQGAPIAWERPRDPAALYPNHRWWKCFLGMSFSDGRGYQVFRKPVAEYLCREWNRSHPPDKRIVDCALLFCMEKKNPYDPGPHPATIRETLFHLELRDREPANPRR